MGKEIIAEVKTMSPFGFRSDYDWYDLVEVADQVGDIVSIHTNAQWGGSFDSIRKARAFTDKKILAKGLHQYDSEIEEAWFNGASFVLVVGRIPKLDRDLQRQIKPDKLLIEPINLEELKTIPEEYKVVWNSRDLITGGLKEETFDQARQLFGGWLCQASNIARPEDIYPECDAILIGQNLMQFSKLI